MIRREIIKGTKPMAAVPSLLVLSFFPFVKAISGAVGHGALSDHDEVCGG
jgi:hypothetical protein